MCYCINPLCPQPGDLANAENVVCRHCGSSLKLRDDYRITKLLNDDSGFAAIYEVSDGTENKILKVLKSHHHKNTRAVELFRQEAVILSQLNHPGIPKVEPDAYFTYFAHNNPEPSHCFVMEKIEGMNLQQWLRQQTQLIDESQAIQWLQQITQILQVVHLKNYFHRDIKLQNIMLRPSGQLVLIDFGAAREMTYTYLAQIGSAGTITRISSAGYTPPEQEKGHAVPQSDFYALGRTFVYLLTGKKLTDKDIYNPLTDEFEWRAYAPQISPQFANFIDCLMSPKAINRPKDTQEIISTLNQLSGKNPEIVTAEHNVIRDENTVIMAKTTFLQKGQKTKNIKRKSLIGGGLAVLLMVTGGYFFVSSRPPVTQTVASLSMRSWQSDRTFQGHTSEINNLLITADRKLLISASADQTIKVWKLNTGELLKTFNHNSYVNDLAISPDGQILASGGANEIIKLWDLATGELLADLSGHTSSINALLFNLDGKILYSASADQTIRIWDLATRKEKQVLQGHTSAVNALAIRPDGQVLASGSADKTIRFWETTTGTELQTLKGHKSYVNDLEISPDGQTLASASADDTIKLWDTYTGEERQTLIGHSSYVNDVEIAIDGKTLVSSSADKTIRFWDLETGETQQIVTDYPYPINYFDITRDLKTIATGSHDQDIHIYQLP